MTSSSSTSSSDSSPLLVVPGSKDGRGGADHDQPYVFGRRPRGVAPFPFTTRQYARLLTLRGRIADGLASADDLDVEGTGLSRQHPIVAPVATSPRLCYSCTVCGAVVAGAQPEPAAATCPACAQDGGRDQVARAILLTAGVLGQVALGESVDPVSTEEAADAA
jgi:hypothetical protein